MLMQSVAKLVGQSMSRDVVVVSWPEQARERERLDRAGTPRLWLVEPGADPPIGQSCLDDWLRLPADDAELRARLVSLELRAAHHPSRPTLDEHGQLTHRGAVIVLSPVEQHVAAPLIARFGDAVAEEDLIRSAGFDGGNAHTLRVCMSRLRHRLAPIGLTVGNIRAYGYVMRVAA